MENIPVPEEKSLFTRKCTNPLCLSTRRASKVFYHCASGVYQPIINPLSLSSNYVSGFDNCGSGVYQPIRRQRPRQTAVGGAGHKTSVIQ